MGELKERMLRRMELRNFSNRTIKIYLYHMKRFVKFYGKSPDSLGKKEIEEYLHRLFLNKASQSGISQAYSALKFFYSGVLERPWELDKIPRPKREMKLPIVLSKFEVKRILHNCRNLKSQMILMTIYSAGLRLTETLKLKLQDIDSSRMQIRIEQGKGKKDRYSLLSVALLKKLREYYILYRPNHLLFPGKNNKVMCSSVVQKAFQNAKKKPGLQKTRRFIHYDIVLRLIFWKTAAI